MGGGRGVGKTQCCIASLKGLDSRARARFQVTLRGRGGGGEYVGGEFLVRCPVVENVPYSPAHWLTRTGTSVLAVGHPCIGVALIRANVSKMVSFRDSLLEAKAYHRDDLKCSFESHG